jgi:5-methylcytosine-specific restriction endonuclease McrA
MRNFRTLVLNANYRPLAIISWTRAIVLVHEERVVEIDFYKDQKVRDGHGRNYTIPAVVARKTLIHRVYKLAPFCKKNVYIRDMSTCQYCGQWFENPKDLTYDHVIPRSKWKGNGTSTCWENIVTCCIPCNRRKRDRTCDESGMFPITRPVKPKYGEMFLGVSPWRDHVPREWLPYLLHLPHFRGFYELQHTLQL